MAKTKLLNAITVQSGVVEKQIGEFVSKLDGAQALTPEHWTLLSNLKTESDKLDQTISKMKTHMKEWDGSTKLKNLFKNKEKLKKARDEAQSRFSTLEKDAALYHSNFSDLVKMMQQISNKK